MHAAGHATLPACMYERPQDLSPMQDHKSEDNPTNPGAYLNKENVVVAHMKDSL
jgi:hypothetical protein